MGEEEKKMGRGGEKKKSRGTSKEDGEGDVVGGEEDGAHNVAEINH